jgi:HSP20 family protein
MSTLQQEMNRLLDTFLVPGGGGGTLARTWVPSMDLVEDDEFFVLRADLPGVAEDDVAIELDGDVLTVSGSRHAMHDEKKGGVHRIERAYGAFQRSLSLPEGIDPGAIAASFDRGVLEVRIPKPEESKPRKVSISVGEGASEPRTLEGTETTANGEPAAA